MADDSAEVKRDQCVECSGMLTHPGAFFCGDCAPEFYGENKGGGSE